jgi:hypothetical protein
LTHSDELDMKPTGTPEYGRGEPTTVSGLIAMLDECVEAARNALRNTTDEHLLTTWKLEVHGNTVPEGPRHGMIREGVLSHLISCITVAS